MSDYSSRINALNREIGVLNDAISVAQSRRQELAETRRQLVTGKSQLSTDKELIKKPETGEPGSIGTHASNHEGAERSMVLKGHEDLPVQVQEMIDAIDSERDRLQDRIDGHRRSISSKRNTIRHLRERQRIENARKGS
ncbi:DUF5082 family protein [Halalkalibacterium halodurans]|jgi:prefoldin subunit 5|uniref:BH0976 protein n=1 Tax=Halalkalibacterium halodurans (strain ATCC BAA-125 / DSM 18197 / FERM 7344 / JCM 9153 / C-125) TaxID=272558 RepID=Q9KE80_HALH5|nr:DUF5082 family protein [Halalkalibacterium halodurans]MDY7221479.1 DUF5082 family protein [Halalkalibacterium halodurans]MDY7240718.1 DUF5082 family protein [Halalkalibacterium halodurans]MED4082025.1 DUF5082 family protein [Halalkalibacterium halodurans]MED4085542.1 DUF5082 family protein [Halalkalibacterium halodurans]MED4103410.1 DUF5082 family protein [Halalkalibacterium halodurans]